MSPTTSPFPPIADYAFLSNCHTGALVAPDGSVTGCACPPSTRPASSATSWTAARGRSGSALTASTSRRRAPTCPERT